MLKKLMLSVLVLLTFSSCDDVITNPPETYYGITGKIMDESGHPIKDVKVFYLFNYYYLPNPAISETLQKETAVDSFANNLYQNFPNPVYNSFFLRYSISTDADITLAIRESYSGRTKYLISKPSYYGIYQHYFNSIVDSLKLENGCYVIELTVSKNQNLLYKAAKKMVVISDLGTPNSLSNNDGIYFFDYNKSFISDTIFYAYSDNSVYPFEIHNNVNLRFQKEGYLSETINTDLYPGILINRDVIMKKEEM